VFKGGCRVEDLQLEATERLEACLAMDLIVACVAFVDARPRMSGDKL